MTGAASEDAMFPRTFVIAAPMTLVFILSASAQEKLVGTYGEARTSLAFKIPDATAQSMLPRGWLASPFSAGPSKGANLVVTFMDWLVALDPDGRPTKRSQPNKTPKTRRWQWSSQGFRHHPATLLDRTGILGRPNRGQSERCARMMMAFPQQRSHGSSKGRMEI